MPNDLSKEERERLRNYHESAMSVIRAMGHATFLDYAVATLRHGLSDVQSRWKGYARDELAELRDERDRLAGEVERLKSSPHPALVRITSLQEQCSQQAARIAELQAVVESKKTFHRCTDRIQPWPGRFCSVTPHSPEADFDPAERIAELEEVLYVLVKDVADYPAWDRPCWALRIAQEALAKAGKA